NATARDSDGTVANVLFYDGTTQLGNPFPGGSATVNATYSYTNIAGGTHTLKATATDDRGGTASATVTITVNAAPYVVITSPANCGEVTGPGDVTLTADA